MFEKLRSEDAGMWHVIDASMSLDDVTSKVNLDSPLPAPASTRTLLPANRYSLALSLFVSVLHMFLSVLTEWCVHYRSHNLQILP